jgi:hypothetical protein
VARQCQLYVLEEYNHNDLYELTKIILMKSVLNIFSGMLILGGSVFFLQGINIRPGSFMTGDPQWAVIGSILIVVGIGLFVWTNLRR